MEIHISLSTFMVTTPHDKPIPNPTQTISRFLFSSIFSQASHIVMGIEEERYHHLNEMKIQPSRRERIGRKKTDIAVFYSTTKDAINYYDM